MLLISKQTELCGTADPWTHACIAGIGVNRKGWGVSTPPKQIRSSKTFQSYLDFAERLGESTLHGRTEGIQNFSNPEKVLC